MFPSAEKAPVLSLAEGSIANLGDLDESSLFELWGVFTKCKDSLQNGRRLENLSWRLWANSSRRYGIKPNDPGGGSNDFRSQAQQNGWSDPEWLSESEDGSELASIRSSSKSPPEQGADSAWARQSSCDRGSPRERRFSGTIRGDSLQRIITDLTSAPAIVARPKGLKALSTSEVPVRPEVPLPPSRGSSAPEVPTPIMSPSNAPHRANIENTPRPSARTTPRHSPRPSDGKIAQPALAALLENKPIVTLTPAQPEASTSKVVIDAKPNPQQKTAPTRPRQGSGSSRRISSSSSVSKRTDSPASYEPRSFVKGFDMSAHENRPREGAKAPPPTPAVTTKAELAASPPKSSMKSPDRQPNPKGTSKKIFFISSPNSDDEDYSDDGSKRESPSARSKKARSPATKSSPRLASTSAVTTSSNGGAGNDDDEWDDEDSSSGWGSEYSTESEAASRSASANRKPTQPFARVPSETHLKPRGPGLLSQLFHPDLIEAGKAPLSAAELARAHKSMPHMQHLHASSDALDRRLRSRSNSKTALRGAPAGAEFESSSDEEQEPATDAPSTAQNPIVIAALQKRLDETANLAPPQTPRTTRRAMLATELSESLRRNLLWERQTRSRAMGAPPTRFQSALPPVRPPQQVTTTDRASSSSLVQKGFNPPMRVQTDDGFRAPFPSPAHHAGSPQEPMRRRHTTGTGLYLQAQQDRLTRSRRNSPSASSSESGSDSEGEPTRFDAFTDGLHHHGW